VGHLGTVSGVTAWIATPEQKSAADVLGTQGNRVPPNCFALARFPLSPDCAPEGGCCSNRRCCTAARAVGVGVNRGRKWDRSGD
jgi:hypothetical protein